MNTAPMPPPKRDIEKVFWRRRVVKSPARTKTRLISHIAAHRTMFSRVGITRIPRKISPRKTRITAASPITLRPNVPSSELSACAEIPSADAAIPADADRAAEELAGEGTGLAKFPGVGATGTDVPAAGTEVGTGTVGADAIVAGTDAEVAGAVIGASTGGTGTPAGTDTEVTGVCIPVGIVVELVNVTAEATDAGALTPTETGGRP